MASEKERRGYPEREGGTSRKREGLPTQSAGQGRLVFGFTPAQSILYLSLFSSMILWIPCQEPTDLFCKLSFPSSPSSSSLLLSSSDRL